MCGCGVAWVMQCHNVYISCMDSMHTIVVNLMIIPLEQLLSHAGDLTGCWFY